MYLHPCVSLNKEKIYREISEHKIAVCEKTAGLRSGNSSDLNSACLKVLVPEKIFQIQDMLNEIERYRDTTDGLLGKQRFSGCKHVVKSENIWKQSSYYQNIFEFVGKISAFWKANFVSATLFPVVSTQGRIDRKKSQRASVYIFDMHSSKHLQPSVFVMNRAIFLRFTFWNFRRIKCGVEI